MSEDRLTYKYLLLVAVFGFIATSAPGLRYLPELTEAVLRISRRRMNATNSFHSFPLQRS